MDPIFPVEVMLSLRIEQAPGEVVKSYLKAVAYIWHEAKVTGVAQLPAQIFPDCRELVSRGLAVECDGHVQIPWVTAAWEHASAAVAQRKAAAAQRWKKGGKSKASKPSREEYGRNAAVDATASVPALRDIHSIHSLSSSSESSSPEGGVQRGKPRPSRRVPADWRPNGGHAELAADLGVSLEAEVSKFRDHEYPRTRTDFDAAFRNWLKLAPEFAPRARAGPPRTRNAVEDAFAEYDARRGQEPEESGGLVVVK